METVDDFLFRTSPPPPGPGPPLSLAPAAFGGAPVWLWLEKKNGDLNDEISRDNGRRAAGAMYIRGHNIK